MKRYDLFYQPKTIGDVLLIIIEPDLVATHYQRIGEAVLIYCEECLIGVNLFDMQALMKIHAPGLILNPPQVLIEIINHKFANDGVDVFLPKFKSNFIVAEIVNISAAEKIVTITDGHREYQAGLTLEQVEIGQHVVIAHNHTLLPNGKNFVSDSEVMVMLCPMDLFNGAGQSMQPLIVNEKYLLGSEYFHWE